MPPPTWISSEPEIIAVIPAAYEPMISTGLYIFSRSYTVTEGHFSTGISDTSRIEFPSLLVDDRMEMLLRPICAEVQERDGHFFVENLDLTIFAGGRTREEALSEFQLMVLASWDGLKDEPLEVLTLAAQDLRNRLAIHFRA